MCEECKATNDRLTRVLNALLMSNWTSLASADGGPANHSHDVLTQAQRVALTELLVMPIGGGSLARGVKDAILDEAMSEGPKPWTVVPRG